MNSLQDLFARTSVEDIVLSPRGLACFEKGEWHGPWESEDASGNALQLLARHVAELAGVTLGLTQPSVDAFLNAEGYVFRAHAVIPPLVLEGPEITLRRVPSQGRFTLDHFKITPEARGALEAALRDGGSILVAGATGSGKTSLLTALLGLLRPCERVLILEDSPELPLPTPLSSKLLARCDRFGFRSGATWDLSQCVFESLRMRPDRLVLGECRGPEAKAIATALSTGHRGILATIHAGSCAEAIERFASLAHRTDMPTAPKPHWDFVVHMRCHERGEREVCEVLKP